MTRGSVSFRGLGPIWYLVLWPRASVVGGPVEPRSAAQGHPGPEPMWSDVVVSGFAEDVHRRLLADEPLPDIFRWQQARTRRPRTVLDGLTGHFDFGEKRTGVRCVDIGAAGACLAQTC